MRTYSVIVETPLQLRQEYLVQAETAREAEQQVLDHRPQLVVFDYEYLDEGEPLVMAVRDLEEWE